MKTESLNWLSLIAQFALVAAIALLAYETYRNNRLLEHQASYYHLQNRLESNEHFINDQQFRKTFLNARAQLPLEETEIVLVYSYHFNTYLKWEWEWQQLMETDPDSIPLEQWGSYLRVYPKTLEAWEWRKSHFTPEFVHFFEENLEPNSRRIDQDEP